MTFATADDEDRCISEVNNYEYRWLKMNLISVDFDKDIEKRKAWYGGTKFMEAAIFLGAFNHLDIEDFTRHLRKINWEFPELVQLIVKEQEDEKFRIVEL